MGKYRLHSLEERIAFAREYLPRSEGFRWRIAAADERAPLDEPTVSNFGLHVGHFVEGGIQLPLDPMFILLMKLGNIPFSRLGANVIRVLSSVAAINRVTGSEMGLYEILYCYSLKRKYEHFHFYPHPNAPNLLTALPNTQKNFLTNSLW